MRAKANAMKEMFIKKMQGDQKDGMLESRTRVKALRRTDRSIVEMNPFKSLESPSKSIYFQKSNSGEKPTKSPSVKRKYSSTLQVASMNHMNKIFRTLQMFWEDKKSTSSTLPTKSHTQFMNTTHTHTQTKTLATILAGQSRGKQVVTEDISTWQQIMEDQYKPEGDPEASDVSELCK